MEIARLVLEYVRVVLTWPVVVLVVMLVFFGRFREPIAALIARIASIKLPGGGELLTPQATMNVLATEQVAVRATDAANDTGGGAADVATIEQRLRSANERAYLWEYHYLNYFLVPATQVVLEWLAGRAPTAYATYDAWMTTFVPNPVERQAMINALANHHLINVNGDMITVNPKGHEYIQWRGPVQRFLASRFGTASPANLHPASAAPPNVGPANAAPPVAAPSAPAAGAGAEANAAPAQGSAP